MRRTYLLSAICLLVSIGFTCSANAIEINFTYPYDGAILQQTEIGDIEASGTYEDLQSGQYLWIFVYHISNDKYYPQPRPRLEDGRWSTRVVIGNDNGIFDLIAALENEDENRNLIAYLNNYPEPSSGPGLDLIPQDINATKRIQIEWT